MTYVAEYAGIAVGLGLLGISPFISLPIAFVFHSTLVFTGNYRNTERVLLAISGVLLSSYVIDSLLMKPSASSLMVTGLSPFQPYLQQPFAFMVAANVGAVIMLWMLFYQTGAVAEKGLNGSHKGYERLETLIGAVVSEALMIAIVIVSAPLDGVDFLSPASLAGMLTPIAGKYAPVLFGIGLASAGLLALIVVSLASTWGIAEALGWRARIGEDFSLARNFYIVYLLETLPAVLFPLLFKDLVKLMLSLMVIFVFVLAVPAVLQGHITSNEKLMGPHVMKGTWKVTCWLMLALVVASAVYALPTLLN